MIPRRKQQPDTDSATGYGVNPSWTGGRFLHKSGRPNIERRGMNWVEQHSWYHTFLQLSRWKFFGVLLLIYVSISIVFATLYFFIGTEHLWHRSQSEVLVFLEAFDDTFSNTVIARTSYMGSELIVGAKFIPMYHKSSDGRVTVMDLDKLNQYSQADIGNAFPGN
jgi:Inward rectifier potassium channel C-terminal domain